eukprot:scaffold11724_cov124-Isochrysis_galbana.AAC.11
MRWSMLLHRGSASASSAWSARRRRAGIRNGPAPSFDCVHCWSSCLLRRSPDGVARACSVVPAVFIASPLRAHAHGAWVATSHHEWRPRGAPARGAFAVWY